MRTAAVVVLVILAAGACAPGPPEHVRLGLVAPLQGERAYLGREVRAGVELAVEDLNDAGGLLGRPVELVVEDDSDLIDLPAELADLAERARVSAVIGPEAPGILLGPRSPLSRRDVPALLATAFGGRLTDAATTVVRTVPSARDQGLALARWFVEVRSTAAVAVLVADAVEGRVAGDALVSGLQDGGVEVPAVVAADPDAPDLGPAVANLRRRAPEVGAVLLWAPPPAAARATVAVRAQRWDVQVAVPASAFVGEYRSLARAASEGVVLPFPFRASWFGPEMERWLVRWSREQGIGTLADLQTLVLDLPVAALAAHDAVGLLAAAVQEAGSREPSDVAQALQQVAYDGLLRRYDLAGDGEAWEADDLYVARFHHLAVLYDTDPRLDAARQRRLYDLQVNLRYLPDDLLQGPSGDAVRRVLQQRRATAPPYEPPLPPPGPVARPLAP